MFRLKSLSITNIRSVEHLELTIDPNGTTALFGPSGVGKSGILDALPWALWGDTGSGVMRREGSTEPAEVTATIEVAGDTLEVTRRLTRSASGRESTTAQLKINGFRQANVTATALTQIITDRTGLTAKAFRNAFYMAQDHLTALMTGTPAKVQDAFEELTGLDQLGRRIDGLREQYKEASIRANALPGDPDEVERTRINAKDAESEAGLIQAAADTAVSVAESARQSWQSADRDARGLQKDLDAARATQDSIVSARAVADAAKTALDGARARVAAARGDLSADPIAAQTSAHAAVKRLDTQLAELTRAGTTLKTLTEAAAAAQAAMNAAETGSAAVDLRVLRADQHRAERRESDVLDDVSSAERTHALAEAARDRLREASTILARLDAGAVHCPTCQQALPYPAAVHAEITEQAKDADHAVQAAQRQLSTARAAYRDAQAATARARAAVADGQTVHTKLEHTRTMAAEAGDGQSTAAQALAALVTQIVGRDAPADPGGARKAALYTHRVLTAELSTARELAAGWDAVAAADLQLRNAERALVAKQRDVGPAPDPGVVAAAVTAADQARAVYDAEQAKATEAVADARTARATAMQVSDQADEEATKWALKQQAVEEAEKALIARDIVVALRRDLLSEYCDAISAAATDVLQRLGGEHVGFVLDASFVPKVVLPDGSVRATRQLSGGEKARAAVCAFIGIGRQLAGGGEPPFLIADEITAAQDETFRREILMMLRSLEMPMIVVSHTADVLDIATHVIRLERQPLGATQIAA